MTITKSTLSALIIGSLLFASCKKEKSTEVTEVTEEDAAELIEGSLEKNSAGVQETVSKYSELLMTDFVINNDCSQYYDTSYNFLYSGPLAQADYSVNWEYILNCSVGTPTSSNISVSCTGNYVTNRMTSADNTSADLTITGVPPTSSTLLFSGSLSRNGSQIITINSNVRSITSTVVITLSNVVVNKSNYQIESGTGTATVTAENGTDSFAFTGDIVFNGGGTATLSIGGNTYTISLN